MTILRKVSIWYNQTVDLRQIKGKKGQNLSVVQIHLWIEVSFLLLEHEIKFDHVIKSNDFEKNVDESFE